MNRAFVLLRVSGGFKVNTLFVGVLVLFLSFVLLLFQHTNFRGRGYYQKKRMSLSAFSFLWILHHFHRKQTLGSLPELQFWFRCYYNVIKPG